MNILRGDITLLRTEEIMDYSLLVAVETNNLVWNWHKKKSGPVPSKLRKLWDKSDNENFKDGKIKKFLEKSRYKFISSCG